MHVNKQLVNSESLI